MYEALLEFRNTPRQDNGLSPTQMMFGRFTRGRLPAATDGAVNKKMFTKAQNQRRKRQKTVKRSYDRSARDLPKVPAGQKVYFQHVEGRRWRRGQVLGRQDERTYIIEGETGGTYRRNRVHIRPLANSDPPCKTVFPEPRGRSFTYQTVNEQEIHSPGSQNRDQHPVDIEEMFDPKPMSQIFPQAPTPVNPCTPLKTPSLPSPRPQRVRTQPAWLKDYKMD